MSAAVKPDATPLGYALLGLLRGRPQTGYALRMVFERTPMAIYSSSPGSIYPALKKLESAGLVCRAAHAQGPRFQLTSEGETALERWLREPVTVDQIATDRSVVLLRFAFLQDQPDEALTHSFLKAFEAAARRHGEELEAFLAGPEGLGMSLHSRVAVEHGIAQAAVSASWAGAARQKLRLLGRETSASGELSR
jgi:DNA-binding PadR family transcriptional regulator